MALHRIFIVKFQFSSAFLGIGAAGLIAGCAAPPQPVLDQRIPAQWTQTAPEPAGAQALVQAVGVEQLQDWWQRLGDPSLNALVDEALARNLSLGQAQDLLQAQRILLGVANTPYLPQFSAAINTLQDVSATDSFFHASVDMLWDPGLFGARESSQLAVYADLLGAQAQLHQLRVELVANVVLRYLDIRMAQRQQAVLQERIALSQRLVALAGVRLQQRIDSSETLHQQQLELAQLQTERAALKEAQARAALALAALLGRTTPAAAWLQADANARLPSPAALQLQILPADMLRTRAPVQLAQAQVEQAAAKLGLSRAALYPRFALGGSLLYSYNMTQNRHAGSDRMPQLGPVIDIPLFDWGRRNAQVDANELAMEAAVKAYRQSVLDGIAEVESALAGWAAQTERLRSLRAMQQQLEQRSELLRRRQQLGLASDYSVLGERRASLSNASAQDLAIGAQALAYVAVFKALGGAPLPAADSAALAQTAAGAAPDAVQRPAP